MSHASLLSPCELSDLLLRAAELLQLGVWTQDELAAMGWDQQKVKEQVRKMESELSVDEGDGE